MARKKEDDDDRDFKQQPHPKNDYDVHRDIQKKLHLAQDYDTPFSEPVDAEDEFPDQHQVLDSDVIKHELYDEGEDNAAVDTLSENVSEDDPAVLGYDPSKRPQGKYKKAKKNSQ